MVNIDAQGVTEESFGDVFMQEFMVMTADGREVPLLPGGATLPVTFANRRTFADMTIQYKCVPPARFALRRY